MVPKSRTHPDAALKQDEVEDDGEATDAGDENEAEDEGSAAVDEVIEDDGDAAGAAASGGAGVDADESLLNSALGLDLGDLDSLNLDLDV